MACAKITLRDLGPGQGYAYHSEDAGDGRCNIYYMPGAVAPECLSVDCEGECVLVGPKHEGGDLYSWQCCCEGGALSGSDGGCGGCGGVGGDSDPTGTQAESGA